MHCINLSRFYFYQASPRSPIVGIPENWQLRRGWLISGIGCIHGTLTLSHPRTVTRNEEGHNWGREELAVERERTVAYCGGSNSGTKIRSS